MAKGPAHKRGTEREKQGPERYREEQREKEGKSKGARARESEGETVAAGGQPRSLPSIILLSPHWEVRLLLDALLGPVCLHTHIHMHPCVCVHACSSNRMQALRPVPRLCPRPLGGPGPQTAGMLAAVTACLCREAGRRERLGSVSVSACVGAAVWGRRAAASTRTCACLPLWWLGGRVGEGCPLPLSHLLPNFAPLAAGP